jgi:hypothetical protein
MSTAEEYVNKYYEWAKFAYSQKTYDKLCDLYQTLSKEEQVKATEMIVTRFNSI